MDNKESKLLQRAKRGDKQAIAALYDLHYQAVYKYIFFRVNDQPTAEDLSAEVFIRMIKRLNTYQDRGRPLLAWLYTIARNMVTDHHRKDGKRDDLPIKDQILTDQQPGPSQLVVENQAQDCYRRALTHLPETQRQVVVGRFIEERSIPEIAGLINKSERAVRSLQHRALKSLERALVEENCL